MASVRDSVALAAAASVACAAAGDRCARLRAAVLPAGARRPPADGAAGRWRGRGRGQARAAARRLLQPARCGVRVARRSRAQRAARRRVRRVGGKLQAVSAARGQGGRGVGIAFGRRASRGTQHRGRTGGSGAACGARPYAPRAPQDREAVLVLTLQPLAQCGLVLQRGLEPQVLLVHQPQAAVVERRRALGRARRVLSHGARARAGGRACGRAWAHGAVSRPHGPGRAAAWRARRGARAARRPPAHLLRGLELRLEVAHSSQQRGALAAVAVAQLW
jgi:hypothetical protein